VAPLIIKLRAEIDGAWGRGLGRFLFRSSSLPQTQSFVVGCARWCVVPQPTPGATGETGTAPPPPYEARGSKTARMFLYFVAYAQDYLLRTPPLISLSEKKNLSRDYSFEKF